MQQTSEVFNQEIQELEAKLEAKKKEMSESGIEQPEKQVFKKVLKEHANSSEGANISPAQLHQAQRTAPADTPSSEEAEKLNTLVAHSFTKGIISAVSEAKKTKNPYLVDMLHDRLADEYYEKLVQTRKINPS